MKQINYFDGKYRYLSNFYLSEVVYEGIKYPTVEHAFQAAKTFNIRLRKIIANSPSPGYAKSLGRNLDLRPDWEDVKVLIMRELVRQKFFNHKNLAEKLLNTGDAILIEGNWWHDNFWGNCWCDRCEKIVGQNNLGKILMEVRTELKENSNALLD